MYGLAPSEFTLHIFVMFSPFMSVVKQYVRENVLFDGRFGLKIFASKKVFSV